MIETLGLRFGYPGGAGLRFADVRIEQGGTLLLRGPSGSGKSTWLALAAWLADGHRGRNDRGGPAAAPAQRARPRRRGARGPSACCRSKLYLSDALSVAGNLALVYYAAGLHLSDALTVAGGWS
jgi:putative ABC transport system ATP-binding protein